MGTLGILVFSIVGACVAVKKRNFPGIWCLLVNQVFAVYIAVFAASPIISLLDIPALTPGLKNLIAFGSVFLFAWIVLHKLSSNLLPITSRTELPAMVDGIGSGIFGALFGGLLTAVLIYGIMQSPLSGWLISQDSMKTASSKVIRGSVDFLNSLTCQDLTPSGKEGLIVLELFPKPEMDEKDKEACDKMKEETAKKQKEEKKKAPPLKSKILMVPAARVSNSGEHSQGAFPNSSGDSSAEQSPSSYDPNNLPAKPVPTSLPQIRKDGKTNRMFSKEPLIASPRQTEETQTAPVRSDETVSDNPDYGKQLQEMDSEIKKRARQ